VILQEGVMNRERVLKVVLVLVGLLFSALVYPLTMFLRQEPALAMMLSLYVTLGIFLLLAARKPSENRSLIAFTAWSSFVHAAVMGVQALEKVIERGELLGVAALVIIGVALIALAPAKPSGERTSAAGESAHALATPTPTSQS
jgi:drug/metabolite transporter superfamily protein YnfA